MVTKRLVVVSKTTEMITCIFRNTAVLFKYLECLRKFYSSLSSLPFGGDQQAEES